jgi:hypothetical protein
LVPLVGGLLLVTGALCPNALVLLAAVRMVQSLRVRLGARRLALSLDRVLHPSALTL